MIDIKFPIGLMLLLIGVLLGIYGLSTAGDINLYAKSLNVNINEWMGGGVTFLGVLLLSFSKLRQEPESQSKLNNTNS